MMKRVKKVVALSLVTGSMFFVSCRENKNNEADESMDHEMHQGEHMNHDMPKDDHNQSLNEGQHRENTPTFQDEQIASLYGHYDNMKSALIQTNIETAKNSAEEFLTVIQSDQTGSDMATAAKRIAYSNDIEYQRQAFSELTKSLEEHLREEIVSGKIYKQYCPMAFEGKGDSWFSKSEQIRNPYYGEKMLNCGKVKDTIDQVIL